MHSDDDGRILTRRELLAYFGASGAAPLVGQRSVYAADEAPSRRFGCVVRPRQTDGPFFVDERLQRYDIRSDPMTGEVRQGVPLELTFSVSRLLAGSCSPLANAVVDVWQCDALGLYSDVEDPGFRTVGQKFLRGYQVTDASGTARFRTIYPGWYPGRTVHIHFKIRASDSHRAYEFASQIYFADELTDRIHARPPYWAKGPRPTRNRNDGLYRRGGDQLLVDPSETGDHLLRPRRQRQQRGAGPAAREEPPRTVRRRWVHRLERSRSADVTPGRSASGPRRTRSPTSMP
jgi:protocatechuate 3,4-dioxygenase beta subunit